MPNLLAYTAAFINSSAPPLIIPLALSPAFATSSITFARGTLAASDKADAKYTTLVAFTISILPNDINVIRLSVNSLLPTPNCFDINVISSPVFSLNNVKLPNASAILVIVAATSSAVTPYFAKLTVVFFINVFNGSASSFNKPKDLIVFINAV